MINILDAARHIVYLSYGKKEVSLTPLKLQKVLYYCQGYSYVWDNKPLFDECFEAWQYGPVNREAFEHFIEYRMKEIPEHKGKCLDESNEEAKETIKAVWDNYSRYGALDLVDMTRKEKPWKEAYDTRSVISNDAIRDYFLSVYA